MFFGIDHPALLLSVCLGIGVVLPRNTTRILLGEHGCIDGLSLVGSQHFDLVQVNFEVVK